MGVLIAGIVVFAATSAMFARCLPRGGRTSRYVGTRLEPYIALGFCGGFALGVTMILASILDMIG
jgi:hypothetical protein